MKNKEEQMYKQLEKEERQEIEILIGRGYKQKEIAIVLGRSPSTISREINKNRRKIRKIGGTIDGKYEARVAHQKYMVRRINSKYQGMKIQTDDSIKKYVTEKLRLHWSPEQIAGRIKYEGKAFYVSKTSLYEWLRSCRGQYYCKYLKSQRYNRKRRRKKKTKRTLIPNRIGIEERDDKVNLREEYGHFEGDTIVSGKNGEGSLVVIQERKSRYFNMKIIDNMKPENFNRATKNILKNLSAKSLTLDNGIENTKHDRLGVDTYFCNPYSSWEKGSIENLNGLIRRYIPKGSDISKFSPAYVKFIVNIINNKPRRILGYKTSEEVALENDLFIKT